MTDPAAIALAYYAAINAGDLGRVRDLLDEDAHVWVEGRTLSGREAALTFIADLRRNFPGIETVPRLVGATEDCAVCELTIRNRAAADDARVDQWNLSGATCDIIEVRDGRIRLIRNFYQEHAADRTPVAPMPSHGERYKVADEQAALRRVATLVAERASEAELFEAVNEEIARIVGADSSTLFRFEPDDTLTMLAAWSERRDRLPIGERRPLNDDMRQMRATGRAHRYQSLPAEGPFVETAQNFGSSVGVPIPVEGRVWGVVFAASRRPEPFASDAEARIGRFGELVAAAISNARSHAELEQLVDGQAALRRVAELVARGVGQQQLFDTVAAEASRLIDDEATTLIRFDADGAATVVGVRGGPLGVGARLEVPSDDGGVLAQVQRTGRPARVDDDPSVPGRAFARDHLGLRSSAGVPIMVEDRMWGALGVTTSQRPLPIESEERLQQFADLTAAALANAQARAEQQRLADEQAALRRVAELVAAGGAPESVFATVAEEASALLDDLPITLLRFDDTGTYTVVAAVRGPREVGTVEPVLPGGALDRVLRTGATVRIDFYGTDEVGEYARSVGLRGTVASPVQVGGRIWGTLAVTTTDRPMPTTIERNLGQFADLVAVAIANAESRAQLKASRARVVSAADDSRRRVQRDVHDGAQQRLVQTIITLKLSLQLLRDHDCPGVELVEDSLLHAERASSELRDLVRGILPASLTRGGLRAGIETLSADLPLQVDLDIASSRLPAATETTAYFVVAEALTNVVKHARASAAEVRAEVHGDVLELLVRDDGVGGAQEGRGTGLTGLFDRIEAGDGSLVIDSPPGGGTAVVARLPIRP